MARTKMTRRTFVSTMATATVGGFSGCYTKGITLDVDYTLDDYTSDVLAYGLKHTWEKICAYVLEHGESGILYVSNFGELYEMGLALCDKIAKKDGGQYYTPSDVSFVMAEWFDTLRGDIICDVGCGTGNLILAYFDFIGRERTLEILRNGRLHLYDLDEVAINICIKTLTIKYGREIEGEIHAHIGDFLNSTLRLPENCKVISNPPYAGIDGFPESWAKTDVVLQTKEFYAAFMEKILTQSVASVVITPYSFIGGRKFYAFRHLMNAYNGFVVSFDNVPGTIFCGRKHGIFNTNTGNSVRAAITVVKNDNGEKGFRFSHLIRFKSLERKSLLKCSVLESFVGRKRQKVSKKNPMFAKCDKRLDEVFACWTQVASKRLGHYAKTNGCYDLYIPNSCRYFTSATATPLSRKGQIHLQLDGEDEFYYFFCMINSSFAYWHWRLYDGGITYPKGLLMQMPVFYETLTQEDKTFFRTTTTKMIEQADMFKVTKSNKGIQENVKYPRAYRNAINQRLLAIIGSHAEASIFDFVHSNMALSVNLGE